MGSKAPTELPAVAAAGKGLISGSALPSMANTLRVMPLP